jgi:hypothetical protein
MLKMRALETDGLLAVGGEENAGFPVRTDNSKSNGAVAGEESW